MPEAYEVDLKDLFPNGPGCISVTIVGDFGQAEPINDVSLLNPNIFYSNMLSNTGARVLQNVTGENALAVVLR